MAESTTSSTSSTSQQAASSSPSGSSPKQFIKPSAYDDELEPDALRGSEQVIKDSGVVDREAERREKLFPKDADKK